MPRPRIPHQEFCRETISVVQDELQAVLLCFSPLMNVIGPAFGAAFLDRALRVEREIFRVSIRLMDTGHARLGQDSPPRIREVAHWSPHQARAGLGVQGVDDLLWSLGGRRRFPLTPAEHRALGARLKECAVRLDRANYLCQAMLGKEHKVALAARHAIRLLDRLCVSLERESGEEVYRGEPDAPLVDMTGLVGLMPVNRRW